MEKETVLEVEFIPVWDKWAGRIAKQNENILKRNEFIDSELKVESTCYPDFSISEGILFIKGCSKEDDNNIFLLSQAEKTLIEEKVKAINEKYGIVKRWRAEKNEIYFCINEYFGTTWYRDSYTSASNKKYENGNYFKTEVEALEYAEYMKKCSLEWHEKRNENE